MDAILILDQARWRCAKDRVEQQLAPAAAIRRNINCALTQRYCVMLAISQRSVVVLVNPSLSRLTRLPAQFRSRVEISRVLLRHFAQVAGVSLRLLGDIGDAAASLAGFSLWTAGRSSARGREA